MSEKGNRIKRKGQQEEEERATEERGKGSRRKRKGQQEKEERPAGRR